MSLRLFPDFVMTKPSLQLPSLSPRRLRAGPLIPDSGMDSFSRWIRTNLDSESHNPAAFQGNDIILELVKAEFVYLFFRSVVLSMDPSVYDVCIYLWIYLSLSMCLWIYLCLRLSVCGYICLSVCGSLYLSMCLWICLSVYGSMYLCIQTYKYQHMKRIYFFKDHVWSFVQEKGKS